MSRTCAISGKRTVSGKTYKRSGLSRKKGGGGQHITSKTKRSFKPNLQKVTILIDGKPKKVRIAASEIRNGVVKPSAVKKAATASK